MAWGLFNTDLADELAAVVREPDEAEKVAIRIGLNPASLKIHGLKPTVFWANIVEEADNQQVVTQLVNEGTKRSHKLKELAWGYSLLSALADRLQQRADQKDREVPKLYRHACHDGWHGRVEGEARSVIDYAWDLVAAPPSPAGSRIPLLVFVRKLRKHYADIRPSLREWEVFAIHEFAQHYLISELQIRQALEQSKVARQTKTAASKAAWLTLLVRGGGKDPQPYTVRGWLYSERDPDGEELLQGAILAASEAELPVCFSQFRLDALDLFEGSDKLNVEIFLPDDLRHRAIDQLPLRLGLTGDQYPLPLGFEHPVVIRCLKRADASDARKAAIARWNSFVRQKGSPTVVENIPDPTPYAAYWLPQMPPSSSQFLNLTRSEGVVCVMIGLPIQPDSAPGPLRDVEPILQAGVPVVIWLRHAPGADPDDIRDKLTGLVRGGPLREIHRRVWKIRHDEYEPVQAPEHICRNIHLLYDDAERLPREIYSKTRVAAPKGRITR
jgi:hypothetical protein